MTKKWISSRGLMLLLLLSSYVASSHAPAAKAHGALVEVTPKSVEVQATFEDGKPMANAQVMVYAPDDLQTPWMKGETDAQGRYQFVPEAAKPGEWEVIIRQAGHGGITTFVVGESGSRDSPLDLTPSALSNAQSPVQKWITIAAVIWGFVGTALFFSSRKPRTTGKALAAEEQTGEVSDQANITTSSVTPSVSMVSSAAHNAASHAPLDQSAGGKS